LIRSIVSLIPDEWLTGESAFSSPLEYRDAYAKFLEIRIANSAVFVNEAQHARENLI